MTKDAILQTIQAIVNDWKGSQISLSLDMQLTDELAEDSVEMMELVLSLEDAFHTTISDEAIDSFETVEDVVVYLEQNCHN